MVVVFGNKNYYWALIALLPLFISHAIGVASFVIPSSEIANVKVPQTKPSPTTLRMSTYDADYYVPTEQAAVSGEQSRITLSRFLSQYVKDHPEVSVTLNQHVIEWTTDLQL